VLGFVALVLVVIGLVHLYLWKRLVRDPLRPGKWRRLGGVVGLVLAVLVPATLIGTRSGHVEWLAWPGYVWIGLMFYLLIILIIVEIPRLAISLWLRASGSAARNPSGMAKRNPSGIAKRNPSGTTKKSPGGTTNKSPGGITKESQASTTKTSPADRTKEENTAGTTEHSRAGTNEHSRAGTAEKNGQPATVTTAEAGTDKADEPATPGIERRLLLARGAAIFAGLTATGITAYGIKTALGPPQLDRVQIPLAKLPRSLDGTRFAVVSDIHLGPLAGSHHVPRIVDMINSLSADVVCIVGDLVDGTVPELGRFAAPLATIKSKRGAYFVTGNHEYYSGFQDWVDEVARLGVRPLRNERLQLGALDLAGVNDLGGAQYGDGPDFAKALGDRDPSRPVILLAHQPVAARHAAKYGVDLQLSGHTHGGQMVPFNLLVKLQQPVVSGYGEVDGVPVYVTNGAGFWGPPVRVGAPPQVTLVELRTS
jgi:predicted MPP superfamily phosphohydrolase